MKIYKNPALWLALFLVIVSHNIFAEVATPPVSPPPQVAASPTATASVAPPQAAASPAPSKASESSKIQSNSWEQADQWLIYGVIFFILLSGLVSLKYIISALSNSEWSLADALSEEASVVSLEADGHGGFRPRLDADGKPIMITELRASSSRMIALVGMILILLMFLGFGIFSIHFFAKTGVMPITDNIVNFLTAGMTLFAPYLVNQFSALFEKLTPKKS